MKTVLYRPVGLGEYQLVKEANYTAFPPRLDWQPIFYPVLNQGYAEQIAKEWNVNDAFSSYCGLVTRFFVETSFLSVYDVKNVGDGTHNELWIPAEDLEEMNQNIQGNIKVVNAFFGDQFCLNESPEVSPYFKKFAS